MSELQPLMEHTEHEKEMRCFTCVYMPADSYVTAAKPPSTVPTNKESLTSEKPWILLSIFRKQDRHCILFCHSTQLIVCGLEWWVRIQCHEAPKPWNNHDLTNEHLNTGNTSHNVIHAEPLLVLTWLAILSKFSIPIELQRNCPSDAYQFGALVSGSI